MCFWSISANTYTCCFWEYSGFFFKTSQQIIYLKEFDWIMYTVLFVLDVNGHSADTKYIGLSMRIANYRYWYYL